MNEGKRLYNCPYVNPAILTPTVMQNHISLRPNPSVVSYLKNFQIAQVNFKLFMEEEERIARRRRKKQKSMQ